MNEHVSLDSCVFRSIDNTQTFRKQTYQLSQLLKPGLYLRPGLYYYNQVRPPACIQGPACIEGLTVTYLNEVGGSDNISC